MNTDLTFSPELKTALREAMELDYAWIDEINPAELTYEFSPEFKVRIRKIAKMAGHRYVNVGRHRIRRALLIAVVAVMMLGLVACAVVLTKPDIIWNETQNDISGTLDITFDVDYPEGTDIPAKFECIKPKKPWGFKIIAENIYEEARLYELTYENREGKTIRYSQWGHIENMSFGLDNENAEFREITINGHKGYSYSKLGNNAITWSDGIYLYDIGGTADMKTIEKMAQSIL
ncbi:MAG: DUF4367 domain-containing protein [Lachnospiraceae bacterium]|nr:DUF4367 domain-containing protein [Lachnospiraceae bacterium]